MEHSHILLITARTVCIGSELFSPLSSPRCTFPGEIHSTGHLNNEEDTEVATRVLCSRLSI